MNSDIACTETGRVTGFWNILAVNSCMCFQALLYVALVDVAKPFCNRVIIVDSNFLDAAVGGYGLASVAFRSPVEGW